MRLNLDNYQGALDVLDEYEAQGYYEPWLPPHRAWILMKLNRLEDAIRTARLGMLAGAEPGQTMNILGILLSMTEAKLAAIEILKEAISYERSLGKEGRPATPLNNAGEVYKEIFEENLARDAWQEAVRLPDGCEHVLPSLNLSMLYMEESDYAHAKQAIDGFESCLAQFPLRSGEEHRALVHIARGRIALHSGDVNSAVAHLEAAAERQQWFGKIGTSQKDLRAAVLISLAQALRRQSNHLRLSRPTSLLQRINALKVRAVNRIRSWWLMRRARQILTEDLNDLEDLYIRQTDSMLEYPTLGELTAGFPSELLQKRIDKLEKTDRRKPAALYYKSYLAENLLEHGARARAAALLDEVIAHARPTHDAALRTHAQILKLSLVPPGENAYIDLSYQIFRDARPELRNFGYRLPVNFAPMPEKVQRELNRSAFMLDRAHDLPCAVTYQPEGSQHTLRMSCQGEPISSIQIKSPDLLSAVNALADAVFTADK